MIIDIIKLKNHVVNEIDIDETYNFSEEQMQKHHILDLKDFKVVGKLINSEIDEYIIDIVISGVMKLEDSVTLEPVNYLFETEIQGNIDELLEEINESSKKSEFSIDIFPIIWENILMEIPIRVIGENRDKINLEGNGWKFVQDEETISINPELEKLKDLLNEK